MGQIKNIKLHIVTDIKDWTIQTETRKISSISSVAIWCSSAALVRKIIHRNV